MEQFRQRREGDEISVILQEPELWEKFHLLTNEMIVTKNGRRMFPVIKAQITGLEPATFYSILLEFKQIDQNRYKYINGEWHPGKFNHHSSMFPLFSKNYIGKLHLISS